MSPLISSLSSAGNPWGSRNGFPRSEDSLLVKDVEGKDRIDPGGIMEGLEDRIQTSSDVDAVVYGHSTSQAIM
jgi:hypothetical protein